MKLLQVYSSNAIWGKLAGMRLSPKMAYDVLKYAKLVFAEYDIVEKTRVALIHEITDTLDNESASIEPDSADHAAYVERFGAMLDVESDLKPSVLKFDALIADLDARCNALTIQEIAALEPFFAE
jgi:hypothetical protein